MTSDNAAVLEIVGLTIETVDGTALVEDVDLCVNRGEIVGLVGESGSGKSLTSLAALRLLPSATRVRGGSVAINRREILNLKERDLAQMRGKEVSYIPQEPMSALNPSMRVGRQVERIIRRHTALGRRQAAARAVEVLGDVGIPNPGRRSRDYPHQFSGGMRQRVLIAMAVCCEPDLLIADEPTTALDVTVQAQILDLLVELRDRTGLGVVFVTHDLGVVAETCDRVCVMYAGHLLEIGRVAQLFDEPRHPYTRALLDAVPDNEIDPTYTPVSMMTGSTPAPGFRPSGCRFHPRCSFAHERCSEAGAEDWIQLDEERAVRCRRQAELADRLAIGRIGAV